MDLLARLNQAYTSDDSDSLDQSSQRMGSDKKTDLIIPSLNIAPEVDVTDLQADQEYKELTRFETTNTLITKKNHLTGVIEKVHINPGKFYE